MLAPGCIDAHAIRSQEPVYWISEVKGCDFCATPFESRQLFVDGTAGGAWVLMCAACFLKHGDCLGIGYGQLYARLPDGKWRKVAGFMGQSITPQSLSRDAATAPAWNTWYDNITLHEPTLPEGTVTAEDGATLAHYTLVTGQVRLSGRGEFAESLVAELDPLVKQGGGWVGELPAGLPSASP